MNKIIAILLPDLRAGGAERVSVDLARAFKSFGYDVEFVLLNEEGEFLDEARSEFSVFNLNVKRVRHALMPLIRYLKHRRPDLLIANMWPLTSIAVIANILSLFKNRLLLVEHITLSNQYTSWGKFHNLIMRLSLILTYRFANKVAAVSEGSARETARMAKLPLYRVAVLYNPIPLRLRPSMDNIADAELLWNCSLHNRILSVGSLKDQKNHKLLIRAFAKISSLDSKLIILGGGDVRPLRKLTEQLGIHERVVFAGVKPDPSPFYATAKLFVLSSDYEGFGNVIVEALSFGLPVVSTDCPYGPAEILEYGKWGILVPVGNVTTLVSAIERALVSSVDAHALITRASDFAPNLVAKRYLELMDML